MGTVKDGSIAVDFLEGKGFERLLIDELWGLSAKHCSDGAFLIQFCHQSYFLSQTHCYCSYRV
jgi:hypothetical protein